MKPGALVLKHFPHGFYEDEIKRYFRQFGTVTRVRVARSRKTNRPRHYAFIKFKNEAVARIAAESMDNYLMFGKRMRCTFVPGDQIPSGMFPKKLKTQTTHETHKETINKDKSPTAVFKLAMRKKRRVSKIIKELKELGIDYSCVIINEPKKKEEEQVEEE